MKNLGQIIILTSSIVCLVICHPYRSNGRTIQTLYRRNGETIAVDDLIQKYEREFQKFHKEETRDGDHLEWPALDNINLSNYCKKYLKHSVPGRKSDNAVGSIIQNTLHYEKGNESSTSNITILKCKVIYKSYNLFYYMTRAPESKCVYSLKFTGNGQKSIFTVINKHCDFEDKPLKCWLQKRKRVETTGTRHLETGQPIAKDVYLLKYELEHQELLKREQETGINKWTYEVEHLNLYSYCHQYMEECVPKRNRENIEGRLGIEKLHYQKLKSKGDVHVTTVKCTLNYVHKRHYYMTGAPERNCVYALLRQGRFVHDPLVIVFKHCDFENSNDQRTISQNIFYNNAILKAEVKGESFNTLETFQFFPKD